MKNLLGMTDLAGVKESTLNLMLKEGIEREVDAHKILLRAKEPVRYLYFIMKGKVIYYNLTKRGKRKIIFVLGEGSMINDAITKSKNHSIYCETIEPCKIFQIDKSLYMQLMMKDQTLMEATLKSLERKLSRTEHQLKNTMGSIYMERKLAAKLWKLSRDFGVNSPEGRMINITMSMEFLGDLMGAPRETTSRLCKTLSEYGLIRIKKKHVYIIDPDRLSRFYSDGMEGLSL